VVTRHAPAVRQALGVDRLAIGLWLSAPVVATLVASTAEVGRLRSLLEAHRLYTFTLNSFPYGDFHAPVVKRAVYAPDWTDPAREQYTVAAARLLAAVAPPEVGPLTLSTLPLGWGGGWDAAKTEVACSHLVAAAAALRRIADRRGASVRLALEPEPGCVVQTSGEAVRLFHGPLAAAARRAGEGAALLEESLGLCFDCCHHAVVFEEPEAAVATLREAGVVIAKAQLSVALELTDPAAAGGLDRLAAFDEPRFLHQVNAGTVAAAEDLGEAIAAARAGRLPVDRPWRIHYHCPIHRDAVGGMTTTRDWLARAIPALVAAGCPHFEVETYTWSVLPEGERPGDDAVLARALAAEVAWARRRLAPEAAP